MRENEILFFLLIIIMVKSRKSGATHTAAAYLASGFIYAKVSFRYLSKFFVRGRHETTIINENHHFLLSSYCRPTKILKGANKT